MSVRRMDWVALPTAWIEAGDLKKFVWKKGGGRQIAALMLLVVLAQNADQETGVARITYDAMEQATDLSRATISLGLQRLVTRGLITKAPEYGRSAWRLSNFDRTVGGWGKLPSRRLYSGAVIPAFAHFKLRSRVELDAMKIYLLFVARRNTASNLVNLSYEAITERTAIDRTRIRSAISFLTSVVLIHVDRVRRHSAGPGGANAYRLVHIDAYRHMGTAGRADDATPFADLVTSGG